MDIAIVIAFLIFIGFREYTNSKHIQDLELKVISKTPSEYAAYKKTEEKKRPVVEIPKDDIVDALDISSQEAVQSLNPKELK